MNRKVRHWNISPSEKNIIISSIEILSAPVAFWGLIVYYNISKSETNNETAVQKANTKIHFFTLVNGQLPIASELKKHVASQGISRSAEAFSDPDSIGIRSFL